MFYSVECGTGHVSRGDDENGTALIKPVAEKQMGVTADCCGSACDKVRWVINGDCIIR